MIDKAILTNKKTSVIGFTILSCSAFNPALVTVFISSFVTTVFIFLFKSHSLTYFFVSSLHQVYYL